MNKQVKIKLGAIAFLVLIGIFSTYFILANELSLDNNTLSYSNKDLKVSFKDALDKNLGTAELKSHSFVDEVLKFGYGKEEVVMYYDFEGWDIYENGLGEVVFIDRRTGKEIEKDFYFVEWGKLTIPTYSNTNCRMIKIGDEDIEKCDNIQNGTKQIDGWVKLENKDIKNTRIGIKTYVAKNDYLDAVWTIAGKKIKKHASWTADLNVDLVYVWDFTDGAGSTLTEQISGINNGTLQNMEEADWKTGADCPPNLNNCLEFGGTDERISFPTGLNSWLSTFDIQDKSWCYWVREDDVTAESHYWSWRDADGSPYFANYLFNSDLLTYIVDDAGVNALVYEIGSGFMFNNDWTSICATWDSGTGNLSQYVGGVLVGSDVEAGFSTVTNNNVPTFGARNTAGSFDRFVTGRMAQVLWYNRTLSVQEMQDIGTGIVYSPIIAICQFAGYVFDEDNNALEGANVTVFNQYDVTEYYQKTTNASGFWEVNITNSTNTYMATAYFNNTLIGQLKPFISGIC